MACKTSSESWRESPKEMAMIAPRAERGPPKGLAYRSPKSLYHSHIPSKARHHYGTCSTCRADICEVPWGRGNIAETNQLAKTGLKNHWPRSDQHRRLTWFVLRL